jgi:predicted ArsR family transcriptional regulator
MAGLSGSQERVLRALQIGPQRAQEIADRLGIDPSAVRRHLDNLLAMGLVEATDMIDGPGRPKRSFRLTAAGRESGPRNYPLLLASLMQKISQVGGRKQLFRYLESIAADLAGPQTKNEDAKKRLDLLLAKYNGLGFQAEIVKERGETVLVQRNCPFLAAATGDPEAFCQHMEEGLIRTFLPGAAVELQSALARGETACRHLIRPSKKSARQGAFAQTR